MFDKITCLLLILKNKIKCFRSVDFVKEYCGKLRKLVDMDAESHVLSIRNYRDELLAKITEYEQKWIDNCEKIRAEHEKDQHLFKDVDAFLTEW